MPGGAPRRQLDSGPGVAMHYKAPQDTETEMPFVDDVDSPEVLLEWQHKAALGPLHAEPIHAYAGRLVAGAGVARAFELARCALAAA